MAKTNGLLSCSVCGEDIYVTGKEGAYLQTTCPSCGLSSQPMMAAYLQRVEREREQPRVIEVYYKHRHQAQVAR